MRNLLRFPVPALAILLLATPALAGFAGPADSPPAGVPLSTSLVNISADQQTFDEKQKKTFLLGNVSVTYQDVHIRTTEAAVDMSPAGEPLIANFYKRPQAKKVSPSGVTDNLEADVIRIHLKENLISAEGNSYTLVNTVAANPVTIRADVQHFDNTAKIVKANGQVQVNYDSTRAFSPAATLWLDEGGKARKVLFTGGARLEKDDGQMTGERITYMVGSGNLVAEQNVKTDVRLKNPSGSAEAIRIDSDYQQFDKAADTMLATGHVRIVYGDYTATGPKASFKLKNGQVDKIYLTGRSTIITSDRRIQADRITITTNPRNFDALGNVKSQFVSRNARPETPAPSAAAGGGKKPVPAKPGTPPVKPAPAAGPAPPQDDYLE